MNLEELFKQRLLRRIPPDEDKVRKSLETAEMFFQKIKPLQHK